MSENLDIPTYLGLVEDRKYEVKFKEHPVCHFILDMQHSVPPNANEYIQKLAEVNKNVSIEYHRMKNDDVVYVKINEKTGEMSSSVPPVSNPRRYLRPALKVEEVEIEVDVCNVSAAQLANENNSDCTRNIFPIKPDQKIVPGVEFYCKVCYRRFNQQANLVKHERIHTGERPFRCDVCYKTFNQQSNLWKHMKTHTGEKPYQCKICHKTFSQHANLLKHIRIHTGERPFICIVCSKTFTQRANLLKHERTHTGEKPYHCRFCSKAFAQQSNVVKHERIHTGDKPFNCKTCLKSFAQQSNLTKHEAVHAKDKPFACKTCDKSYTQKCNLQKHEKRCQPLNITQSCLQHCTSQLQ